MVLCLTQTISNYNPTVDQLITAENNVNSDPDDYIDSELDIQNYSIVEENIQELKIKLRLSAKQNIMAANVTPSRRSLRLSCAQTSSPLTRTKRKTDPLAIDIITTPSKGKLQRRKTILKTESDSDYEIPTKKKSPIKNMKTPKQSATSKHLATPSKPKLRRRKTILLTGSESEFETPTKIKTPRKNMKTVKRSVSDLSTPSMTTKRISSINQNSKSDLHSVRESLHVSSIPSSLPCREVEFENISNFLEDKILDESSGCMYVSGVPGTGKTATTTGVIRYLKQKSEKGKIPLFRFIEINGMRLSEPKQAYVQIYQQLSGKTISADQAHSLLEKRFTTSGGERHLTTVLLVDELDMLCNRRQDVVYNLLDWPSKKSSRLIVITIANTMDLPERLLMGKVTSRLGLTRLTFQPYTYKQLEEIVNSRLNGTNSFRSDAIQLITRKVAAVSGDARRALDICRRATEISEEELLKEKNNNEENMKIVNMKHVQKALEGMISSPKVQAIKNCSRLEQIFLQGIAAEILRTGIEETCFNGVYIQFQSIVTFMGLSCPSIGKALKLCNKLGSERLIICEHSRTDIFQKIFLNVSTDDIHYALQVKMV